MKITHTKRAATPVQSSEAITCGILDSITKYLKNLPSNLVSSLVGKLKEAVKEGLGIDKVEEGKDGIFYMRVTAPIELLYKQDPDKALKDENLLKMAVRCAPVAGKADHYDMSFKSNVGKIDDQLDVPRDQIVSYIERIMKNVGGVLNSAIDDTGTEWYQSDAEAESEPAESASAADNVTEGE